MKYRAMGLPMIVAVLLSFTFNRAWSQEFKPSKQIETVVHTGPGGGSDLFARAIAELLQKEKLISQRMQVVNKSGGGSAVAMSYLAEKKGETHTIGFFTGVWVTNPLTTAEATVTMKDLTPIVRLVLEPAVIAVKADSPYKTMKDFIEAAKKSPNQLRQSGGSVTSRDNLMRMLIQKATGTQWTFISFPSGGERLSNLLGGHVQMMVIEPQEAGGQIELRSVRDNGRLVLQVSDNGPGLIPESAKTAEACNEKRERIGLNNTQERLRKLYGENHQFDLTGNARGGVTARLSIPFRVAVPAAAL